MATLTKKDLKRILNQKMKSALKKANDDFSISIKGISEYNYYKGLSDGYRKALELIGNMEEKKTM